MSRKIRQSIVLLGIMVLVLVLPLAVNAEDTTGQARVRTAEELRLRNQSATSEAARIREQIQNRVAEFKANLGKIRDNHKRALVENINNRMCSVNQNQMSIMSNHLERMDAILNRIEERARVMNTEGQKTENVTAAVTRARNEIQTAREAVNEQREAECVIDISGTDTTVGSEVRNSISQLESKVVRVRTRVRAARQAVAQAIRILATTAQEKISVSLQEGA